MRDGTRQKRQGSPSGALAPLGPGLGPEFDPRFSNTTNTRVVSTTAPVCDIGGANLVDESSRGRVAADGVHPAAKETAALPRVTLVTLQRHLSVHTRARRNEAYPTSPLSPSHFWRQNSHPNVLVGGSQEWKTRKVQFYMCRRPQSSENKAHARRRMPRRLMSESRENSKLSPHELSGCGPQVFRAIVELRERLTVRSVRRGGRGSRSEGGGLGEWRKRRNRKHSGKSMPI
jgi:hypothetical protein